MIEGRELSAVELLDTALRRVDETEPLVHAFAYVDRDGARDAAAAADREIARGAYRGSLHGIPVGIKDVIRTSGIPTEAGSIAMTGGAMSVDAVVVAKLRDAGAVVLGKTTTHEFAWGQNTPPTRCPWDTRCYPGGSSAGSGVAVAVGSLPVALGTDTAGSIRNPAAVNGIVGLKPTHGLVSTSGVIPVSSSLDAVGPLARTAADAKIVFDAIADSGRRRSRDRSDRPEGVRVGVDRRRLTSGDIVPAVVGAFETALAVLVELGVTIVDVESPDPKDAMAVGMILAFAESAAWHRHLLRRRGRDYDKGTRVTLELGSLVLASDYFAARAARETVREDLRRLFEANELTLMAGPTMPTPTVPLERLALDFTREGVEGDLSGTLQLLIGANVAGLPAMSIPCGVSTAGLPIGLHLVARPFEEDVLFAVAAAYERATPWHRLVPTDVATVCE